MPSLTGVFGGSKPSLGSKAPGHSRNSSVTRTQSLTDVDEYQQLEDAMRGVSHIMEDDLEGAERALESGNSVYHKLGAGVVWFMRATMGYEPEIMRGANERLGIAESAASEQKRRAQRDQRAFRSNIYPQGTEYAVCNAEAQIMSAIIGLTTESLSEALKGFYKVRKALTTLESVAAAEKEYLKARSASSVESPRSNATNGNSLENSLDQLNGVQLHGNGDDAEVFADAEESGDATTTDAYLGHMESSGMLHDMSDLSHAPTKSSVLGASSDAYIPQSDFNNPVDIFVHSGYCLFHGMLLLMLSFVPPTFNKILSLIGFRGDRDRGLELLWRAAGFPGLNGALAGLVVIGFYSGTISSLEIVPSTTIPRAEWDQLVEKLRKQFPKSGIVLVEDARAKITARRLDEARHLLTTATPSPIKQVESMRCFEIALTSMYLHRYEQCAGAFLKYIELNTWSHATCYYIAAACHVELYRTHKYGQPDESTQSNGDGDTSSPEAKAKHHAAQAEQLLAKVPQHIGKKRFFSRQPPFDTFVARKHAKWTARAKQRGVSLVDAVGVSPMEEMVYFWAGYKRMQPANLRDSLTRLSFTDGGAADPGSSSSSSAKDAPAPTAATNGHAPAPFAWKADTASGWADETDDEKASLALLRATVYRHLGEGAPARALLQREIVERHRWPAFKASGGGAGREGDLWALPCARYELAACAWTERERGDGDGGRLLQECGANLEQVAGWENFDLDTRIGMKIAAGRETVRAAS